MSDDDVCPDEMNEPHDFDDATTEAFLTGGGRDVDPGLADLFGDVRAAYTSTPPALGAELSALMGAARPAAAQSSVSRRFEQMRSSILPKFAAGVAAFVAATGGLAAAHALPAPVQDAVSHLGIGTPAHHDSSSSVEDATTTTVDPTATTMPSDQIGFGETATTTEPSDGHGSDVSNVARDGSSEGCDHGATVSGVATDGNSGPDATDVSSGDSNSGSSGDTSSAGACETTTTIPGEPTPTTVDTQSGDNSGDGNVEGDTTTTLGSDVTTTTMHDGGGDSSSPSGGDTSSSGDTTNTSDSSGSN